MFVFISYDKTHYLTLFSENLEPVSVLDSCVTPMANGDHLGCDIASGISDKYCLWCSVKRRAKSYSFNILCTTCA